MAEHALVVIALVRVGILVVRLRRVWRRRRQWRIRQLRRSVGGDGREIDSQGGDWPCEGCPW